MNIILIKLSFEKRRIIKEGVKLVEGDYNSTKIVFEFDKEYEGRKVFELAKPDTNEAIFVSEIINNEVLLVTKVAVKDERGYIKYTDENEAIYWYDEENNKVYDEQGQEQEIDIETLTKVLVDGSIFNESGRFPFEVTLYNGDSKLTSVSSGLSVAEEMVRIGDEEVSTYLPIFDQLIAELNQATSEANNLDIDAYKVGTVATITVTKKDGTVEEVEIHDGEQGEPGIPGQPGQPGYTPQKGIDYFTEADKEELEQDVKEQVLDDIVIPSKVSDLENDESFQTDTDVASSIAEHNQSNTAHQDIRNAVGSNTSAITDLDEAVDTLEETMPQKQNITDNNLQTNNKNIVSAINEVNSIAKGANQAISYGNYQTMITAFNALQGTEYNAGQNVMIITLEVPDLWISSVEQTSQTYTYVDDATVISDLAENGYIQVGYYRLSMLETQKVDLTNYYNKTETDNKFVDKIAGKGLSTNDYDNTEKAKVTGAEQASNKVTTISSESTNTQYPGAKAVYDYIESLDIEEVAF